MIIPRYLFCFVCYFSLFVVASGQSCVFYVYDERDIVKNYDLANAREKSSIENVFCDYRIDDTTFNCHLSSYCLWVNGNRRQSLRLDLLEEPTSCNTLLNRTLEDRVLDKFANLDSTWEYRSKREFNVSIRGDSIFYNVGNKSQLRYLLSTDTLRIPYTYYLIEEAFRFNNYNAIFLGEGKDMLFGQPINTLIFKSIYLGSEITTWFNKYNMVLVKEIRKYSNEEYSIKRLKKAYQF
jgi:hypothetical protein